LLIAAHQQITRSWWELRRPAFDLYVSQPVLEEARAGDVILARKRLELLADIRVLALTESILKLAESLVAEGPIPRKAAGDALHIAIATSYACEYLLTWNCRHIANAEIQRLARPVVRRHGYELPVICTPEELMGGEE
jgi:PIN domain